jgi:hypothetical protein
LFRRQSRLDEFEPRAHFFRVDRLSAGALTIVAGGTDSVFGALGNEAALEMHDGAEHVKDEFTGGVADAGDGSAAGSDALAQTYRRVDAAKSA